MSGSSVTCHTLCISEWSPCCVSHQPGARCCRGEGSEHAVGLGSAERRPGGKAGEAALKKAHWTEVKAPPEGRGFPKRCLDPQRSEKTTSPPPRVHTHLGVSLSRVSERTRSRRAKHFSTWLLLIFRCLHLSSCRIDSSVSPSHSAGGSEDSRLYKHADKQIHFVTVQSKKTAVYCGCRFAATKSNTNTAEPLETEPESAWNPLGTNESTPPPSPLRCAALFSLKTGS